MKFLCGISELEGTNAERRIKSVLFKGKNATQTYSLKETTGMFNGNEKMYSSAQKEFVGDQLRDMIFFFDYAQFENN